MTNDCEFQSLLLIESDFLEKFQHCTHRRSYIICFKRNCFLEFLAKFSCISSALPDFVGLAISHIINQYMMKSVTIFCHSSGEDGHSAKLAKVPQPPNGHSAPLIVVGGGEDFGQTHHHQLLQRRRNLIKLLN